MTKCVYTLKNSPHMVAGETENDCDLQSLTRQDFLGMKEVVKISYVNTLIAKNLCIFHNRDYALAEQFQERVMKKFHDHIKDAKRDFNLDSKDTPTPNGNPVKCVGFQIPGELNFKNERFFSPVDFTAAEFHKKVAFNHFCFDSFAKFDYAQFHNKAIFSNTIFNAEASFSYVRFMDNAYFTGTPNHTSMSDYRYGKPQSKKINWEELEPYFPKKERDPLTGREIQWGEDPATLQYLYQYAVNKKDNEQRRKLEAKREAEEKKIMAEREAQQREEAKRTKCGIQRNITRATTQKVSIRRTF